MKIFKDKHLLQKDLIGEKSLSFVPTMGGLHKGHISLIKKAKNYKGKILVSIFINPKQFNNKNDFKNYPRNLKTDLSILKKLNTDIVYIPNENDIFSFLPKKKVYIDKFSSKLCGKFRKGHFKGVLNVINRFLEIIKPKRLLLGLKDFQQLILIKKHTKKRRIKVDIISCKTIREKNGIACSSRNQKLDKKKIKIASKVHLFLNKKKRIIKKDLLNFNSYYLKKELMKLKISKVDYVELYNLNTLKKPMSKKENFNLFVAYYLGNIRLIDNF